MVSAIKDGTVKQDFYYTRGGNNHQSIYSYETKPIQTPVGNVSAAIGTDYRLDDGGTNNRTVFDTFLSIPIFSCFSFKGRARTNYSSDNTTTQFRGGLQVSGKITDRLGVYAQGYVADKLSFKGKKSNFSTGAFAGADYRLTDSTKVYAEMQAYDLNHTNKDNIGVNVGIRYSF